MTFFKGRWHTRSKMQTGIILKGSYLFLNCCCLATLKLCKQDDHGKHHFKIFKFKIFNEYFLYKIFLLNNSNNRHDDLHFDKLKGRFDWFATDHKKTPLFSQNMNAQFDQLAFHSLLMFRGRRTSSITMNKFIIFQTLLLVATLEGSNTTPSDAQYKVSTLSYSNWAVKWC